MPFTAHPKRSLPQTNQSRASRTGHARRKETKGYIAGLEAGIARIDEQLAAGASMKVELEKAMLGLAAERAASVAALRKAVARRDFMQRAN